MICIQPPVSYDLRCYFVIRSSLTLNAVENRKGKSKPYLYATGTAIGGESDSPQPEALEVKASLFKAAQSCQRSGINAILQRLADHRAYTYCPYLDLCGERCAEYSLDHFGVALRIYSLPYTRLVLDA
jgi:hypothetical protein